MPTVSTANASSDTADLPAALVTIGHHAGSSAPVDRFYGYHEQPAFLTALATRHAARRNHVAVAAIQTPPSRAAAHQTGTPSKAEEAAPPQDAGQSPPSPSSRPAMAVMILMSDGDEGDGGGMDGSGNGESVTVTSSPPSSGDGGGFQTSGNTMPTSPPGSSTQYITVHGHAVTVVNGVDYLTNNSGNGIATYQTSSGTFVPIKLSDIDQDIADDIKNVLRPFSRGR